MRTRTAGAVTLLLAAGTVGLLPGTAAAAPADGRGATTEYKATTQLGTAQGAPLTVAAAVTRDTTGALVTPMEVYVDGLVCTPLGDLTASLVSLESATLTGSDVPVTCAPAGGQGLAATAGTVDVDLAWTGTGPTEREGRTGNRDHCVGRVLHRAAALTGSVTVTLEGGQPLTVGAADGHDSALSYYHTACPPPAS
ncbi:hypothetical protein SAMN04488107_1136 [Geodermatophilus saharensis]|uniref:Neocarzinostatin family protein n=1 Tax=Geodermatophilus saharensis TaxID=1137994 RepID=A0A239BH48_9ACTN|nr:hypothetical protein [Geodermatophilus saharensis]SNS06434.1 hypothetical protein SAMN04488107_1136 [Geodermatophilus saharensis]